jgi:protein translocase SEC61 complex gamma subunit
MDKRRKEGYRENTRSRIHRLDYFFGEEMQLKIRERLENYRRVLQIAKKPDSEEFKTTAKICAIGIGIIGVIGFVLYLISVLFLG